MIDVPIQVKDALRDGRLRKNYRFNVLNNDGTTDFTIDNDTLVSESVSIDERMCSGDTIKFGLCEGSSLEFQYFNHANITGRQIQAFIDVFYGEDEPYAIPMGFFTVKNCSRQASTGIIKATCYNKLQSDYLDQKANMELNDLFDDDTQTLTMFDITNNLLEGYKIEKEVNEYAPSPPIQPGPSFDDVTVIQTMYDFVIGTYALHLSSRRVDSPFNYCEYGHEIGENQSMYVLFGTKHWSFSPSDESYFLTEYLKGHFEQFERNVADFIINLIDGAKMYNSSNQIVSGQTYLDHMLENQRFAALCGIWEEEGNNSYYYSTIQYEYNVAHNLTNRCRGSAKDYLKKIHSLVPIISMPLYYTLNTLQYPSVDAKHLKLYPFDGTHTLLLPNNTYDYYDEDGNRQTKNVTALVNADGSDYRNQGRNDFKFLAYSSNDISDADMITATPSTIPDFTLRELQTAIFETQAQFGQLDRVTDLFSGVELNHSRLLPQDTLYPDTALYPDGAAASATKSMYSKLWADEGNIHKWRYLIITYKGLDENNNEADFTLQRTVNADGTDNYNCSDNWLFRNLVWTAEDIGAYADAMVAKMQDITWFPFEMWCAGLPYLETGDEIEIPLGEDSYTSYVLQRQLKGIQNLQDTYINGTLDIF